MAVTTAFVTMVTMETVTTVSQTMSMNVPMDNTDATPTQVAEIPSEVILVPVIADTKETDTAARRSTSMNAQLGPLTAPHMPIVLINRGDSNVNVRADTKEMVSRVLQNTSTLVPTAIVPLWLPADLANTVVILALALPVTLVVVLVLMVVLMMTNVTTDQTTALPVQHVSTPPVVTVVPVKPVIPAMVIAASKMTWMNVLLELINVPVTPFAPTP